MKRAKKERIWELDFLRGFAIILVVIGHVFIGFHNSKFYFSGSTFLNSWIYSFHMPLMFMISGYVHGMKEHFQFRQKYSDYLRKYVTDIYIPCLYFSFTYWLARMVLLSPSGGNTENFHYASSSELLRIPFFGYHAYWFMCSLFFVKILHLLLECYVKREGLHIAFWVLAFIIINSLGGIIPSFFRHFTYGLYFHTGFILKRHNLIPKNFSLGIIFFLAGTACFYASHHGMSNIFMRTGASMFTSLAFFVIFYALSITNRFLVMCGVYSMVIYALHDYVTTPFRVIYRITGLYSSGNPFVLTAVCFFFALMLSLIPVWLYKNVKCLRWIEYIFYPGRYKRNPLP